MKTELLALAAFTILAAFPADALTRAAALKRASQTSTYCAVCSWLAQQAPATPTSTYVEPPAVTSPVIEGGVVVGQ